MPSPFPGMDPYLEGYLWPDVHHRLATHISAQLTPLLRPRYVARIEIQIVKDRSAHFELGIMYPDVEILTTKKNVPKLGEAALKYEAQTPQPTSISPAPFRIPITRPHLRLARVEIRDVAHNHLITAIEILSPVNKREPGLGAYLAKRHRLYTNGIHLLEIDLLRRGTRPGDDRLNESAYVVTLTRAHAGEMEVWPVGLRDTLPVAPVPLVEPDPDVPLDLQFALTTIYAEAAYDLSIDYSQDPPPPPLTPEDQQWLQALVRPAQEARS